MEPLPLGQQQVGNKLVTYDFYKLIQFASLGVSHIILAYGYVLRFCGAFSPFYAYQLVIATGPCDQIEELWCFSLNNLPLKTVKMGNLCFVRKMAHGRFANSICLAIEKSKLRSMGGMTHTT